MSLRRVHYSLRFEDLNMRVYTNAEFSRRPFNNSVDDMATYRPDENQIPAFCEQLSLHREREELDGLFQDNEWNSALIHAPFASGKTSYIPFLGMHYGPLHKVVVIFPSIVTLQSFVHGCRESGFEEIGEFSSQANTVKTLWNMKKCERPTNIICTTAGCYNFLLDFQNFVADYIIFDECHKSDMLTDLAIFRTMKKKLKMIFMTATFDLEEAQHLERYMTVDGGIHRVFRSTLDPPYLVEFFDCNGDPLNENALSRRPPDKRKLEYEEDDHDESAEEKEKTPPKKAEKEKNNGSSEESEQEATAKKDDKKKGARKSKKPQPKKRKVEYEEDDHDESAEEKEKTPPKKVKKSNKEEKSEIPGSIDLGNNRFAHRNIFKGKKYIYIREYYRAADRKLVPTKNGLSSTLDQMKSLIAKIPEIKEKFF